MITMKKKMSALVLCFCMIFGLFTTANAATIDSNYGVNINSKWYNTAANPYFQQFYGQCTWYVWGRAMEKCGVDLSCFRGTGNAETWLDTAQALGFAVGNTPRANSIVVMKGYGSQTKGIGHVAFVEKVDGSTVYYTEGNRTQNGQWYQYFEDSLDANHVVLLPNTVFEQRIIGYIYLDASASVPNGIYTLTPKCAPDARLDVQAGSNRSEANIQIYEQNHTAAQQFALTRLDDGSYEIRSMASGMAVDVKNGSTDCGTNVWQYYPNSTNAQRWVLKYAEDGYYYIVPKLNTNLCLDVDNAASANETNVQVWTANQTNAQKWKLTPVG